MRADRAAAVFLAICLITFGYAARPAAAGYRHTILVFTWLCAALAATLVVFSMVRAAALTAIETGSEAITRDLLDDIPVDYAAESDGQGAA